MAAENITIETAKVTFRNRSWEVGGRVHRSEGPALCRSGLMVLAVMLLLGYEKLPDASRSLATLLRPRGSRG